MFCKHVQIQGNRLVIIFLEHPSQIFESLDTSNYRNQVVFHHKDRSKISNSLQNNQLSAEKWFGLIIIISMLG